MEIYQTIKSYLENEADCINLIASENILPKLIRLPYESDLINRYVFKSEKQLYFSGREDLYQLELKCCNIVADLLETSYVSLKPISGLNVMMCVFAIFTKPGDIIYSINPQNGGHHVTKYMLQSMARESRYIPFDEKKQDIDFEALEEEMKSNRVAMIYIDFMNVLHDVNVKKIRSLLSKRTLLVYDASHIMALIMGKEYLNPLKQGADILVGTTHKTVPGPHKAIFATDNVILYKIFDMKSGVFISSQHPADVFTLGILLESMKNNMHIYAHNIISNARNLAEKLSNYGLPVIINAGRYTDTHQLWIGQENTDLYPFIDKMMDYKIKTNGLEIPFLKNYGIRIGVQEVTFCGFNKGEITELAECIGLLYNNKDEGVKERIEKLIRKLDETTYLDMNLLK